MNRYLFVLSTNLLFIFFTHAGVSENSALNNMLKNMYIDFDQSIATGFSEHEYEALITRKHAKALIEKKITIPIVKNLYQYSNFLTKVDTKPLDVQIPRIVHQIWLGSELPERYKKFQESWKKHHPDWEYKLWTDADVKPFKLANQRAYDLSKNYAEKANVFRYEILDRFGGLYVDTDFECFKSFEILHQFYEFYTGMATINRVTLINNGLIGAIPGHPILKACIKNINKKKKCFGQMGRNGTIYFGETVLQACQHNKSLDLSKILILPPTYVYPWPGKDAPKKYTEYILDSSFAVHYWDGTWTKSSEFKIDQLQHK